MTAHARLLFITLMLMLASATFTLLQGLNGWPLSALDQQILLELRLPQLLTALIVGAALSLSSAVLQVLLRNPLADPGIIGITSGASLCAALYLLIGQGVAFHALQYGLPLFCFVGAMTSTLLIYRLARRAPDGGNTVILAGIAISTLCGAIVAWLHLFSDAESMRNLLFWLMGSLHQANWPVLSIALPVVVLCVGYLLGQGKPLNWLYLGSKEAQLAGLNVHRFSATALLCSAVLVGVAVSIAGSIAFVGLLVPHFLRQWLGYDNRIILPMSALCGALLMVWVGWLSTGVMTLTLPVSMITATVGGPLFLWALMRQAGQAR
ncbi:iron ABC transporter permease [Aestuariibacter halophilus]|uniref:Iron ABC transporter permease n=1 Tax=Fluctibacter halophilus TaxID=226011 RepID=A0ABS8G8Q2_9ALTE|nr:iron ABC transporter permease [Aestuariibacter halophilus]MCC2616074.1 iron ABC transporter permease [Aestuariibacter halophilus]